MKFNYKLFLLQKKEQHILYPIKFIPIYKEKLWGGTKLKSVLGKDFGALSNCGETWEVSALEGHVSVVENGRDKGKTLTALIVQYKEQLMGKQVYQKYGNDFPLLVKFIDANKDLSIQVHPNDELALSRHNSWGKTEMWYVVQADEGSSLISGFNREMDKEKYLTYFEKGKIEEILNTIEAKKDDVFFLPSGRVHTIGKGLLIAEIQQSSDITYRIYDFDRKDADGNLRELHTAQALDAIDFQYHPTDHYKHSYKDTENTLNELVKCNYFQTNKLVLTQPYVRDYASLDSFRIMIFLEGSATLVTDKTTTSCVKGDVFLIPAQIESLQIIPDKSVKLLETYVADA